jgi:hypothetical protein
MTILLADRSLILNSGERFVLEAQPLSTLTSAIILSLRLPTTLAPIAWNNSGKVNTKIIVIADGIEHSCSGRVSGGIHKPDPAVDEISRYELKYGLPYGRFGVSKGRLMLIGERATCYCRVEVECFAGHVETEIEVLSI